jgi:hypothetical protein
MSSAVTTEEFEQLLKSYQDVCIQLDLAHLKLVDAGKASDVQLQSFAKLANWISSNPQVNQAYIDDHSNSKHLVEQA